MKHLPLALKKTLFSLCGFQLTQAVQRFLAQLTGLSRGGTAVTWGKPWANKFHSPRSTCLGLQTAARVRAAWASSIPFVPRACMRRLKRAFRDTCLLLSRGHVLLNRSQLSKNICHLRGVLRQGDSSWARVSDPSRLGLPRPWPLSRVMNWGGITFVTPRPCCVQLWISCCSSAGGRGDLGKWVVWWSLTDFPASPSPVEMVT